MAFRVTRSDPKLVAPAIPTPHELKQLSDTDSRNRFHIRCVFFYKNNPTMDGQDPAKVIREALARALIYYYPLAGRLIKGTNQKLYVDCTAEGVIFIEASADITLDQLGDTILSPYQYLDEVLYNIPGSRSDNIIVCPLLLVQVSIYLCTNLYIPPFLRNLQIYEHSLKILLYI